MTCSDLERIIHANTDLPPMLQIDFLEYSKLKGVSRDELADWEEKISKQRALELFDSGRINEIEVGTFRGLTEIHRCLFQDIYTFAGELRPYNFSKGNFKFASARYLPTTLKTIDEMPQESFTHIVEKYIEMNIAHPFLDGNGRATRIWLDMMLKKTALVVDWSKISKQHYFAAMIDSTVNDSPLKALLNRALTHETENRSIFMAGLDASYDYEGLGRYKTAELSVAPNKSR